MSKKMDEIGDDEKKAEAAGDEIDGYFKTLGDDFENAWDAGQDAADGSPEATAMDEAVSALDGQVQVTTTIRKPQPVTAERSAAVIKSLKNHDALRTASTSVGRGAFCFWPSERAGRSPPNNACAPRTGCAFGRSPVYSRHLTRETLAPCG